MGLDAAGNTTAAIGKGFAIGSAAFVSLALYGAFITRSKTNPYGVKPEDAFVITDVQVTDALLFSGLLIGAMLPYAFSAMTMKSVGKAALEMVFEIRKQLTDNPKIRTGEHLPDYERCVAISTSASLKEMVGPGALSLSLPWSLVSFSVPELLLVFCQVLSSLVSKWLFPAPTLVVLGTMPRNTLKPESLRMVMLSRRRVPMNIRLPLLVIPSVIP